MDADRARELLAQERSRIEHALAELRPQDGEDPSASDQDPADAGADLHMAERDASEAERLSEALGAVERAEQRLADGTYGKSVESGEPIPDARLEAQPTAERTVEEQSRVERGA